jgi:DNA-directed RNA polymerase subunit K/omega
MVSITWWHYLQIQFYKGNKMSRNTSQKAAEQVGGLFNLVLVASARVRELKNGHKPKVTNAGGITATALKEIEEGHIGPEYLKKVPKQKGH